MYPECIICKGGRSLCGKQPCPLLTGVRAKLPKVETKNITELSSPSPPSVFVGRYGYPTVGLGAIAPWTEEVETDYNGDPAELMGQTLEDVAGLFSTQLRSKGMAQVNSAAKPRDLLESTQLVALSEKPVDIDMTFKRPVKVGGAPSFDSLTQPMGPVAGVLESEVTGEPAIPKKVDAITSDGEVRAVEGIEELAQVGIGEAHLNRLLSAGLLGIESRRRLVPTRWSITATDDILGKRLWSQVVDFPSVDRVEIFRADYLDNQFQIIITPGNWAFQMIECWHQGSLWAVEKKVLGDWEEGEPKTAYADRVTGAYYAARLAVLEHLVRTKRRGAVFVYRDIGPRYWAPVGVWLIRETVRKAMNATPKVSQSIRTALNEVANRATTPRSVLDSWFAKRTIQTRLSDW